MTRFARTFTTLVSSVFLALGSSSCTLEDLAADLESNSTASSRYGRTQKKKKTTRPRIPSTKRNAVVLAQANKSNTKVVIDIGKQKAYLLVNGKVGMEAAVSTARSGKYTPRGTFRVTERVRSGKHSTIYGVEMPYWMRLSGTVFGVHAGYLPGYPASAGCIRMPAEAVQTIYENTGYGTSVSIYSNWNRS